MTPQDNQPDDRSLNLSGLQYAQPPTPIPTNQPTETTFGDATVIKPTALQSSTPESVTNPAETTAQQAPTNPTASAPLSASPLPVVAQPQIAEISPQSPQVPNSGEMPIASTEPISVNPPQQTAQSTNVPPASIESVFFGGDTPPPVASPTTDSTKKKMIALIAAPIVALLFISGGVFGLYLPNTPENVWKTGLSRTGKAVDKLTLAATEEEKLKTYDSSEVTGKLTATFEGQSGSVDLNFNSDTETSNTTIDASIPSGQGNAKASLNVLTELAKGKTYPDIYFKLTGIKDISIPSTFPGAQALFNYDGRWIAVDNQYLESIAKQASDMSLGIDINPETEDITAADIASFTRSMVAVTNEYVFTSNSETAVIVQKEFVGKEKTDDVNTHHYKATLDKENTIKYCRAINTAAYDSQLVKKFFKSSGDEDINKSKTDAIKSCDETAKNFDDKQVFDIWIESGRKVIHKVRVYETEYIYDETNYEAEPTKKYSKTKYYEFGQTQTDDNTLTLFLEYFDTKRKDFTNRTEASLNLKSNVVKASGKYADKESDYDVSFNLTVKPSDKSVEIKKPTDATPIQDVLNALGVGDLAEGTHQQAGDTERKNDLKMLQLELEAYFNDNGKYPDFLDELGLTTEELTDSSGTYYSYVSSSRDYTLSIKLENTNDPDAENGVYTIRSVSY